jgi:predicted alpha-1,2-mannosidase
VYRSLFPLLTIVAPDIINDQINSMVSLADENGKHYFDRWELMNSYTGCMCGSPEVIVLNDAYQKGIRHYDTGKAYQYAVNTCDRNAGGSAGGHSVAITMQNAIATWNLSQLATQLGHPDDAIKYAAEGNEYRNVFNPDVPWTYDKAGTKSNPDWKGWVCPKDKNGNWQPWEGLTSGNGAMESSLYEEGWAVPQDVPGLIKLVGGQDLFVAKLTDFFERTPKLNEWNAYDNQANEPSNLIPFLFNRAGAPWLTQYWVRRLLAEAYSSKPNGECGDDDEGQISAWFALSAGGLSQACPGDPRYEVFTPLFDKVTFKLNPKYSKGNAFVVVAKNNSAKNVYIQSASLNGKPLNRCWLNYSEITAGGTLELVLGPEPNKQWGLSSH